MANPNHPNNPNRPNQPQQNRPQQPQQPRPVVQPTPQSAPVESTPSVASTPVVTSVIEAHSDFEVAPLTFSIEPEELEIAVAEATTFEQLLSSVIDDMIAHRISAQESKKIIHTWLLANPDFTRQDAETTLSTLKGAVETVVQEIPRMLSR